MASILRYVKGENLGNNAKQTDKNGELLQRGYWRTDNEDKENNMGLGKENQQCRWKSVKWTSIYNPYNMEEHMINK